MALSASWQDAAPRASPARRAASRRKAFAAARRHTRLVRTLRIVLPVVALSAVAVLLAVTQFSLPGDFEVASDRLSVTRNAIIMDSPRISGFDRNGRQYFLNAERAEQAIMNPDQVQLQRIEARVVSAGRGAVTVTAASGEYDHGDSTLDLRGEIVIDSEDGYTVRMNDADIDFRSGYLTSPNPVSVGYQGSEIVGDRFSASQSGDVLTFDGGVRTTLMPPKRGEVPSGRSPAQDAP